MQFENNKIHSLPRHETHLRQGFDRAAERIDLGVYAIELDVNERDLSLGPTRRKERQRSQ